MEIAPHVTLDLKVRHGEAAIAGTKAPDSIVIESLAGGMAT